MRETVCVNPPRQRVARENTILSGLQDTYHDEGFQTSLTVKSVVAGTALYQTPQSRYRVEPDRVLVLDAGQRYSLDINPPQLTETLAVFFRPGIAEWVFGQMRAGHAALLDDPEAGRDERPAFVETVYPKVGSIGRTLACIHAAEPRSPFGDRDVLPGLFYDLLCDLIRQDAGTRLAFQSVPAVRRSTREELCRRILHAKDWIDSMHGDSIKIADAARVARLSEFHFHRTFRAVVGQAPGQYLQRVRVGRARELLAGTRVPIREIAAQVGYESPATFSRLFARMVGCSPSRYRTARQRPGEI